MSEINIAPTDELIRFLCLFRRWLNYFERCIKLDDNDGTLLCIWIADAVHNVPLRLCYYDPDPTDFYSLARQTIWVNSFPQAIRDDGAPDRIVQDCESIFSTDDVYKELGLDEDLSNLNLAPPDKIEDFINLVYNFCITVRFSLPTKPTLGNYLLNRLKHFWRIICFKGLLRWHHYRVYERFREKRYPEYSVWIVEQAGSLQQAATGLVHWDNFDEDELLRTRKRCDIRFATPTFIPSSIPWRTETGDEDIED